MPRRSTLFTALAALCIVTFAGTAGYTLLAGMTPVDALYMTVITLSTVGFREVTPLGPTARIFTIVLIFGGISIVFYCAGVVARDIVEGELRRTYGRRRVQRKIDRMKDHYLVCGFGRMGHIVCKELAAKPAPFVIIERDPAATARIEQEGYLWVEGDATEDEVLEQAGIRRARGLITALPTDSRNLYVVLTARELNPTLAIVARAEDQRSERKLLRAGATRVVSPYVIGGHRMANALLRPGVLDVVDLATHYRSMELQIEEVEILPGAVPEPVALRDSGLREELHVIVIAIKRPDGEMVFNPGAEERISSGDRLIVMGERTSLQALESKFLPA